MKYRTIGNTGLSVSEIGFGCGGTAGLMVFGSFEDQVKAVARALELGINYFDESPDYGDTVSEVNLGKVLKELGASPIINTKVEVRAENLDDIAGHVERSIEASLQRLGVDHVDIVQIHNGPTVERPNLQGRAYNILGIEDYLAPNGALEGLERIKASGKTQHIGFICRGNDAGPVRQLIDTGVFSLINTVYTLVNPTAVRPADGLDVDVDWGQCISYARDHGVGAAIYAPLAGGLLTDNTIAGGPPHPTSGAAHGRRGAPDAPLSPARQRALNQAAAFKFLSNPPGQTLAQAAQRFILMEPGVSCILGGFSDTAQLEEAVAASEMGPLTDAELKQIGAVWASNFGALNATA